MKKYSNKMHLFKSREPNLIHYVTTVTYNRVPVFGSDHACSLLIDALARTRSKEPFKLIGYVIMPDHFHMLVNPLDLDISLVPGRLKGRAASSILQWLRSDGHLASLEKLALARPLESGQTHAVWLREFSAIDIWSRKFIRQKLHYIHMNPVRAGLCDHPAKWRWSSYHAYFPHEPGSVPIEVDQRWLWTEEELNSVRSRGGQVRCLNRTKRTPKWRDQKNEKRPFRWRTRAPYVLRTSPQAKRNERKDVLRTSPQTKRSV